MRWLPIALAVIAAVGIALSDGETWDSPVLFAGFWIGMVAAVIYATWSAPWRGLAMVAIIYLMVTGAEELLTSPADPAVDRDVPGPLSGAAYVVFAIVIVGAVGVALRRALRPRSEDFAKPSNAAGGF